ncbi:TIGR00366 family protein [Arthrobacter echini]|uniref:TIGR00366 family protein n=1 Tax=Arthrobacter echini TaxID=1529066 RepID=UPI003CCC75A8
MAQPLSRLAEQIGRSRKPLRRCPVLITWGLGLVIGGLLAKEVAAQARAKGIPLHFPMLVAAGFSGFVVWHMGYSGSGPLTAATEGSFSAEQLGRTIPVAETTFSWWNITATIATVVLVPGALALVAPKAGERIIELQIDARHTDDVAPDDDVVTPTDELDASRVLITLVGSALVAYLVMMAISYGDQWTNMIQPFWALPLLAIASLNMRDILGYTMITLILSGLVSPGPCSSSAPDRHFPSCHHRDERHCRPRVHPSDSHRENTPDGRHRLSFHRLFGTAAGPL